MKTASKVMYTIGRIFNIIALIIALLILILGIVCAASPNFQEKLIESSDDVADLTAAKAYGITLIIIGAVMIVIYSVLCALASHASKALNNTKKENAPHIIMIIIGIFGDIFYLLGGIFGLVAESENSNKEE